MLAAGGGGVGEAVGGEVAVGWLVDVGVSVGSGVQVAVGSGSGVLEAGGGAVTSALVAGGISPLQAIRNSRAQISKRIERDRMVFMVLSLDPNKPKGRNEK